MLSRRRIDCPAHYRSHTVLSRRQVPLWDAIVVCGCPVRGHEPSVALERRLRHALDLWRRGCARRIVVTGGAGEAVVGARYLTQRGVPAERIVMETRARSTQENARFTAQRIGRCRVMVVSDGYHLRRCRYLFSRWFHTVDTSGPAIVWRRDWRMVLREVGSWVAALVLPARRGQHLV